MFDKLREKLNQGGAGTVVSVVLGVVAVVGFAVFMYRSTMGESTAAQYAGDQVYMCAETKKTFKHTLQPGESIPLESPFSGKKTAYPADRCWWNKDGTLRNEPTFFLRNSYTGEKGPTFCPECGRLFDPDSAMPSAGSKPPPTKDELLKNRSGTSTPTS